MSQKKLRYIIAAVIMIIITPMLVSCVSNQPQVLETPVIITESIAPETPDGSHSETLLTPEATPEPVPTPETTPEPEPTPEPVEATDITSTLNLTLPEGASAETILDGDYATKHTYRTDAVIEISADEEIHSLYLIWDLPPGGWKLTDGITRTMYIYGEQSFIHEYISDFVPTETITIRLPENGAVLCDIYAFSEGYPPDWVQAWLSPLEKADLLVLPTHADDEHLFFVGAMPYYAVERGLDVQVAYMTNHWNEQPRPHELLDGLWTVGIRNYPVISGFNDRYTESLQDAQSKYGHDTIVSFHVELLRRFKPSVVLGHDLNGEYGHGAHMLNAHALRDAVEKAADENYHGDSAEKYGTWDTPKLYLHLYSENAIIMDWDIPLEAFGGATARDMAVKGYDCHESQHKWAFAVPPPGSTGSGSKFGLVRTLVGPDILGGDMFENIG